jgi:hypothetical protein
MRTQNAMEVLCMPQMVQVCIGCVKAAQDAPRFQVMDELGLLRTFWTKREALAWMQPSMRLVVIPKPKREKQYIEVEQAWL